MSTKKILNRKTTRDGTMRRSQVVRELQRMARAYQPGSAGRFRIESLATAVDEVRRDPRFTAEQKDAKFKALLNRAR